MGIGRPIRVVRYAKTLESGRGPCDAAISDRNAPVVGIVATPPDVSGRSIAVGGDSMVAVFDSKSVGPE